MVSIPMPNPRAAKVIGAAIVGLVLSALGLFEGREHKPYLDAVGVLTVCEGHTGSDIIRDKVYSDEECDHLVRGDAEKAYAGVMRVIKVPLPDKTAASLLLFTFNVGEGALARSTLARRLNAGEGEAACDELLRWTYAGGRQLRGLVKRRAYERDLCISGFHEQEIR